MSHNSNLRYGYHDDDFDETYFNRIKSFLREHYAFRKNEILEQLEYKSKEMKEFQVVDTRIRNNLYLDLRKKHLYCSKKIFDMLLNSEFIGMYNPFQDFIEYLPEWDNIDYIKQLTETIDTNDKELLESVFKKWFVGIIGSLSSNGEIINYLFPILIGNQSESILWIKKLIPYELEPYYFEGTINPSTMYERKKFVEKAIIYLIELQPKTNQKKFEELKFLIASKEKIKVAYRKNTIPRIASVIGTTEQQTDNDILGNKLVICFEVNSVDYTHQIPVKMVFAQAKHLYESGFPYQFDISEITEMKKNQKKEKDINIQELVFEYIEPSDRNAGETILSTPTEIVKYLFELAGIERNIGMSEKVKIGQYLSSNGFESFEGHAGIKRYCYKLKEPEN